MSKTKIGIGTASLLFDFLGLVWCISYKSFCIGDIMLNSFGLRAWSNGNNGSHLTIIYSLIFFIPALVLGIKYREHFGAKAGKTLSLCVIPIGMALFFTL
jgi:hypothetical protein